MTAIRQLALDLPGRAAQGREDFFVAPSNALAVAKIDQWPRWSPTKLVVTGPPGSGKSHLAAVWATASGAQIVAADAVTSVDLNNPPNAIAIEDAHGIAGDVVLQEALFHLHNAVVAAKGSLLITGRGSIASWGLTLPDLKSRLDAADAAELHLPDDTLLSAVLVKLFDDRQLIVTPDLISYLVSRIDRSFIEAETIVRKLDHAALSLRRRVTRALAVEILRDDA